MKNENRVSFTVRLNLNNPRHLEAWNRLRSGSCSYSASIVDALTKEATPTVVLPDAEALKAIVRQAVSEALCGLANQPVGALEESSGKGEISDEDFDIADGFLSGLGC